MGDFLTGVLSRLRAEFDPRALGEGVAVFVANLAVGLLTFAGFYLLWRVVDWVLRAVLRRSKVDRTSASFLETALKYIVLTLGVVQALSAAGVNAGAVVASLGLAGLTIGFAARDALSNLISGVLIFWDRPFVIGDLVEVGKDYGRVERITLRSTRIVTVDGRMLAVPNSTIINSTVASYTNFPHLRLDIDVTVGVGEDLGRVKDVLLAVVRGDAAYMADPAPRVVVTALNDYNVAMQLQVWLDDERDHIGQRFTLREHVFCALRDAGVDMPFETIEIVDGEAQPQSRSAGGEAGGVTGPRPLPERP